MTTWEEYDKGVDKAHDKKRALIEELKRKDPEMGAMMEAAPWEICNAGTR